MDEIFSNSRPVLVVMEAVSHYILSIELADDRKAETWENHLRLLQDNGLEILLTVKDSGSSMKAAAAALGIPERVDLFHLLKPFDPYLGGLERHAYGAIEAEINAEAVFFNRKSAEAIEKYFNKYEQARLNLISEQFGDSTKITQALKFMRGNLEDYWRYFENLEFIIREYSQIIP